jgi:hypothetical protein
MKGKKTWKILEEEKKKIKTEWAVDIVLAACLFVPWTSLVLGLSTYLFEGFGLITIARGLAKPNRTPSPLNAPTSSHEHIDSPFVFLFYFPSDCVFNLLVLVLICSIISCFPFFLFLVPAKELLSWSLSCFLNIFCASSCLSLGVRDDMICQYIFLNRRGFLLLFFPVPSLCGSTRGFD